MSKINEDIKKVNSVNNSIQFKKVGHKCYIKLTDGKEHELHVSITKKGDYANIKDYIPSREWLSMSRIETEGTWVALEMKAHEKRESILLTEEEKKKIAELEAQIKSIKDAAKSRQPKTFEKMTKEEKIAFLKAQLEKLES